MQSLKQILSYTHASRITKNILTEYYQHELLASLFAQKNSQFFSFIGGTAIRICYGGNRYSEDLDFDTSKLDTFDELLTSTIRDMTAKGFVIESRLIHKGAYHCYLKFPGVLKSFAISGYSEEKLLIKVDATTCKSFKSTPHILNKYGVFETIKVVPISTILSKKLLTIPDRKRPKGRDLYDVTYLWGIAEPDLDYLHTVAGVTLKDQLYKLSDYVDTLDLSVLSKEVSPFLINPDDLKRVTQFKEFLQSKIT